MFLWIWYFSWLVFFAWTPLYELYEVFTSTTTKEDQQRRSWLSEFRHAPNHRWEFLLQTFEDTLTQVVSFPSTCSFVFNVWYMFRAKCGGGNIPSRKSSHLFVCFWILRISRFSSFWHRNKCSLIAHHHIYQYIWFLHGSYDMLHWGQCRN